MIQKRTGDLFSVDRGIIVHGCNCFGVMGSGVAAIVRQKFPLAYTQYMKVHHAVGLGLGDTIFVANRSMLPDQKIARHIQAFDTEIPENVIVANAMTQYEYGGNPAVVYVDYDAVFSAFARIRMVARDTGLPVHFPLIGCGLPNGNWAYVSSAIEAALGPNIEATLWELPAKI